MVGLGCGTGQQWLDFCAMVGHPEWMEDPKLFLDRTALAPTIDAWVGVHTVDEMRDLRRLSDPQHADRQRVHITTFEQFAVRDTFVAEPT